MVGSAPVEISGEKEDLYEISFFSVYVFKSKALMIVLYISLMIDDEREIGNGIYLMGFLKLC